MLRKIPLLLIFAVVSSFSSAQTTAANITLDDLLAKNLKAHGGGDKLGAVKTVRMTGALEYVPGSELALTIDIQRPEKVHYDFTLQGMTQMQGYDGKLGWGNDPFSGKRDAEPLGEDDLKDIQEQADFGFGLSSYKEKGYKLELLGLEPVEGSDAYKVKVSLANGDEIYYYLDT